MLHIDLCCGLGGWQAPFKSDDSWRSVGIDIRPDLNPDVVADVRQLPLSGCEPTLITASPPCQEVSRYQLPWYNGGAKSGEVNLELFEACFEAVEYLNPTFWVLENVVGLHDFYGQPEKKVGPFWLWGSFPPFDADQNFRNKMSIWGGYGDEMNAERARIPYRLSNALKHAVEVWS